MTRIRTLVGVPLMASALLLAGQPVLAEPAVQPTQPSVPDRYLDQQLNWKPCFPDGPPPDLPPAAQELQCASFTAPRDWFRPDDKQDVTVAVSRLPATGEATASVLTNPGGPGAPGRTTPLNFGERDRLRASQEIIGIDPRGTGDSTNITCGDKAQLDAELDPRDRGQGNLDLILNSNELIAQFCQEKSGELGQYVNTEQTVRDYDLLRQLLDRETVNWVGYSGGTWLGAHYATAFPDSVGRFVLDSNVEFTTTFQDSFDWQPLGFERRFREDFLPWVAKYDSTYQLGATGEEVRQAYEDIRAALTKQLLEVDGTEITAPGLDEAIAGSLYSKDAFPALAENLAGLAELTGVRPAPASRAASTEQIAARYQTATEGGPQLRAPQSYDDAYDASFITITCNDTPWTDDRDSLLRKSAEFGEKWPLLGWGWVAQPCISWDRPAVSLPTPTGAGVPPVLMVQSTNDPATPLEGARRAHERFAGSRMITVADEGDHGIYAFTGNECVDEQVERYLVDGEVPAGDTTCPGMPLPNAEEPEANSDEPRGLDQDAAYREAAGSMPR
ncbi:alpha/beta hydrolase [Tamaricihabitans halophyticus]|nr:alpha/beta hydrolase [Tamaricihabitans halophyticus]